MVWSLLALAVVVVSIVAVALAVRRVRELVRPTLETLGLLRRDLQPAVVRVRDAAAEVRARRASQ